MKDSKGEPIHVGDTVGVRAYNRVENVKVLNVSRNKVVVDFPISGGKKKMVFPPKKVTVIQHEEKMPNEVPYEQSELLKASDDLQTGMRVRVLHKGIEGMEGVIINFPNPKMVNVLVPRKGATTMSPVIPVEEVEAM